MGVEAYQLLKQLSIGRDGSAYYARHRETEKPFEVRTLSVSGGSQKAHQLEKRCMQLALLRHPSVLKLEELNLSSEMPFLVLEWCERESIASLWERRLPVPPEEALPVLESITQAIAEAHRLGVVHGQLNPSEIFRVGNELRIDFTDVDVSSLLSTNKRNFSQAQFAPPETLLRTPDPAADAYAIGHIIYWALFGSLVRHGSLPNDFESKLASIGKGLAVAELSLLLRKTLSVEASERPSVREILRRLSGLREPTQRVMLPPVENATTPASKRSIPAVYPHTQPISQRMKAPVTPAKAASTSSQVVLPAANKSAPIIPSAVKPPMTPALSKSAPLIPPMKAPTPPPMKAVPMPAPSQSAHVPQATQPISRPTVSRSEEDVLQTTPLEPAIERVVGRYQLLSLLGEGGVGAVYRAKDESDGTIVAVKTIQPQWLSEPEAVARFLKEARLLSEIRSPYVVKLLEVNEDDGKHFIVMEYIQGGNLRGYLQQQRRVHEPVAISLISDVVRALIEVHANGVVHRDIKPENILLVSSNPQSINDGPRAKLTDFGIARSTEQSQSMALTQPGGYLGTPLYMSPEQCVEKRDIDHRADIYSLGATLFHIVTGKTPFSSDTTSGLIAKHCNEAPPNPQTLNGALSDAICEVILKCLAKTPQGRYQDAKTLLHDLERVQRGEPTSLTHHPPSPEHDPKEVMVFDSTFETSLSPQEVWPYMFDTGRANRVVGVPPIHYYYQHDQKKGPIRYGKMSAAGIDFEFEEHPYEWVAGKHFSLLREYQKGLWRWLSVNTELSPKEGGGTRLHSITKVVPRNFASRMLTKLQIRQLNQKYTDLLRKIEGYVALAEKTPRSDAFEAPHQLPKNKLAEIRAIEERLLARGVKPTVAQSLVSLVAEAPPQVVARIRPLATARRLKLPENEVVSACLHAVREGLLVTLWDILCPVCRVPSQIQDSLQALQSHGKCEACNIDFELDFSNSVELIFQAHPNLRDTKVGVYCVGNPLATPHVVAQVRIQPKERIEVELALTRGDYRVRGLSPLAFSLPLRVEDGIATDRIELMLEKAPSPDPIRLAKPGAQLLIAENKSEVPLVVRIESAIPRDDVITAAKASSMELFRELFPREVLSAGQLINVAKVCFLFVEILRAPELYQQLGEQRAFSQIFTFLRNIEAALQKASGAMVKTTTDGALLVFEETTAALRFALGLRALLQDPSSDTLQVRASVHHGSAMVTTLNEHLDYFGTCVNFANRMLQSAPPDQVVVSEPVMNHPGAVEVVEGRTSEIIQQDILHQRGAILHLYPLKSVASSQEA
jgi:serine/threonine protein kinase/class 3 adenylate cyclase